MTGQPKLSCRNIWKLYGQSNESFLIKKPNPTLNEIMAAGVIAAVRLADRIAMMKDGALIQVATPEELVLNLASDYVEELPLSVVDEDGRITGTISKDKVISVRVGLED